MLDQWTRGVVVLVCAMGLAMAPADAWAQDDDEGPPSIVTSLTYYGLLKLAVLSTAAGCFAIQAGTSGMSWKKGAGTLICVTIATVPGTSVTLVGGQVISEVSEATSGSDEAQREVAAVYLSEEADALSTELALGGGVHLSRITELMEVQGGAPLDHAQVTRCVTRARVDLWADLAGGVEGLGRAADTFASCARGSR